MRPVDYCTGLFVWGREVFAHLVVGGGGFGWCSRGSWWTFKAVWVVCVCVCVGDQVSASAR